MITSILGKKIGMTQVFSEDGSFVPVTVVQAGPCHVMQVRTKEKDGYDAVQLGFDDRKRKNATKPASGHAKAAKTEPKRFIREIRSEKPVAVEVGQVITADAPMEHIPVFIRGDKPELLDLFRNLYQPE